MKLNNLQVLHNDKFQTAQLGCFFRLDLTPDNLSLLNLLGYYQSNVSQKYATIEQQERLFEENYGLEFTAHPEVIGTQIIMKYELALIEPDNLADSTYDYENLVAIFQELVLQPLFQPETLQYFELTKAELQEEQQEILENPANLAFANFNKIYYREQPLYQESYVGKLDLIKQTTLDQLQQLHQAMLSQPALLLGHVKQDTLVHNLLAQNFGTLNLNAEFAKPKLQRQPSQSEFQEDTADFGGQQTQLLLGYASPLREQKRLLGFVFAQYLTGSDFSSLFQQIREELGAVYGITATNLQNQSRLIIEASVAKAKLAACITAIEQEITNLAAGQVDAMILEKTKKLIIRNLKVETDSQKSLIKRQFANQLLGRHETVADLIQAVTDIERQDLAEFAGQLVLKERYTLV